MKKGFDGISCGNELEIEFGLVRLLKLKGSILSQYCDEGWFERIREKLWVKDVN